MAFVVNGACWRCLLRVPMSRGHNSPTVSFSTSAVIQNIPKAPTNLAHRQKAVRGSKTLRLSKKRREKTGRPPAPGERKELRKRIVISNTNAFEIPGLREWSAEINITKDGLGHMLAFPGTIVDKLRTIQAFKSTQGWGLFRRPASLVRDETTKIAQFMNEVSTAESKKDVMRKMVVGDKGSGKSVLLLQAHAMAFMRDWVVVHIPEARDLTNAHTDYSRIWGAKPATYTQKNYYSTLLGAIAKANGNVLSNLKMTMKHTAPVPNPDNVSLLSLAELGAVDADISRVIFEALWKELTVAGTGRPPILFTLDGLAHVSRLSEYLADDMHHIHAHDLSIVKHFMSCLSGDTPMPNGGIVLAADSLSNRPSSPALDLAIRQNSQMMAGAIDASTLKDMHASDPENPWQPIDERSIKSLRGLEVIQVDGLDMQEARTVLEYYAMSGMLRQTITENLVAEKWALAGSGLVGELERGTAKAGLL